MPALVFESNKIKFSLSYDTLTMYSKFKESEDDSYGGMLAVQTECGQLYFVQSSVPTKERKEDVACKKEIDQKYGHIRFVHRDEDDHPLYHKDDIDMEQMHSHLNFKNMLTREQLGEILDIIVRHSLITPEEKSHFLEAFDQRYVNARQTLDQELKASSSNTLDKKADVDCIINFIKKCSDNDILADLHQFLEMKKFDYLREKTGPSKKSWQGTNALNKVVDTSESWAMIEKAFTLQMAHNIEVNCNFTKHVAKDFAKKLSHEHRFFSLKHHKGTFTWSWSTSPSFDAFRDCNTKVLDTKYEHFFQKYKH